MLKEILFKLTQGKMAIIFYLGIFNVVFSIFAWFLRPLDYIKSPQSHIIMKGFAYQYLAFFVIAGLTAIFITRVASRYAITERRLN